MILSIIIISIALTLIVRQWRANNIKGRPKGVHIVPKGHSIWFFNPCALYLYKAHRGNVVKAQDHTLQENRMHIKKNEVAIIALNESNALKRARRLLTQGGYEPEEAKTVNIETKKVC